jgi:serine/threonine protein kinase
MCFESSSKIDIWAMGINLYLMLFGVFPFDAKKDEDIPIKIIKNEVMFPVKIPISKTGSDLLKGLLEKNQALRVDTNSNLFDIWYNAE